MKAITFLLLLLYSKSQVECARILGIFPVPAPSHHILGSALMKGLADKGHDVTIITPFNDKNVPKNGKYREIILTGFQEEAEKRRDDVSLFGQEKANPFLIVAHMHSVLLEMTELTLNHTNVRKLIHSNEKFDVVIVEQFMNDGLKAFSSHFRAPLVLFSTIGANSWVNLLVGNPSPTSYIPAVFLSFSSKMTFYERTINSLMYLFAESLNHFYVFPRHAQLVKKYFPSGNELSDVLYNASIVLINSHESTNQPVPHVPNMIDIGGFHVKPSKKLPQDLEEFLDNAKDGVIYFSLGSNLKSSDLPIDIREAILKTFAKLKHKILWKWEADVLPGQPPNVKLSKWFPQQEILAHPNVKLFITHGGLLSTIETIYHGVPVLAIPIFGDQKINAQNIINSGFGLSLSYREITEKLLTEKLNQLLTDPKYTNNAKKRSHVFHDRINKPMDTAIYWVEYVIRHGGAPHLAVAAVDLLFVCWIGIVGLVLSSLLTYVSYIVLKKLCGCCRTRQEKVKKN